MSVENIQAALKAFPEVTVTQEQGKIIIRAKYMGKQEFSKLCSIIRQQGGQRISEGRNSHWEIKGAENKPQANTKLEEEGETIATHLRKTREYINKADEELKKAGY